MRSGWLAVLVVVVSGLFSPARAVLDPTSLSPSAPLSAGVGLTIGTPADSDQLQVLGDWDGREDLVADHLRLLVDDPTADRVLVRPGFSPYSIANGGMFNLWYAGTDDGFVLLGTQQPNGDSNVVIPVPAATMLTNAINAIPGDAVSSNVAVTGIAVSPVADMGYLAPMGCGVTGEIVYIAVRDRDGGSNDGTGQTIHTRIFALGLAESGGNVVTTGLTQVLRHRFHNLGGIAVDDSGALYFQLVDLEGGSGGAIFRVKETPHSGCMASDYTSRAVPPFLLDGNLNLDTAELEGTGFELTNYSGASPTFGNVVALATSEANTLYAAVARSKNPADDAATQATEGPFENPAALGATPSMVISFADAAGQADTCTSPGGEQPGILPIGDGVADPTQAGAAITPGVNNFRAFVLGNGPVPAALAGTLQLDMQIDWSTEPYSGLMVDEEHAVHVASGAVPSGIGTNPSPDRGEVLKFPDRRPYDRRADAVDLRGDVLPDPPDATAGPDGDSDRFDHVFVVAPNDGGGHPAGITGLARGFLRYLNRMPATGVPNLPPGVQGDDDTDGPIAFDALDPSGQVAGGDDARAPFTGDDAAGGFEFAFGGEIAGTCTAAWTEFWLNSNGNLTFGAGDTNNHPDIPKLLSGQPRVAPLWSDWNPGARASSVAQYPLQALGFAGPNAFKVRWIDVAPFGSESCGGIANASVTLYDDGTGDDESSPGTAEGPTTGTPRPNGSGHFYFDYGRADFIGEPNSSGPVMVGYSRGGQDLATPDVAESDWSQLARRDPAGLLGDPTKALQFELFDEGKKPAPQVEGKIDFDLRFAGNDPASSTQATQPDPSLDTLAMGGIDCSATGLTCPYKMVIDPAAIAGGSAFNQTLAVQGGEGPYTFAITAGALPTGVALTKVTDPQTAVTTDRILGGATQAGAFSFEVTATDANQCTVTAPYAFTATCIGDTGFPSLECRVADLAAAVAALPEGKVKKKLGKSAGKIGTTLGKAKAKADAAQTKPEKKLLKKTSALLKQFAKSFKSKAAKKALSPEQVADLDGRAASIKADVDALRGTL